MFLPSIKNKESLIRRREGELARARELVLSALDRALAAVDSYHAVERNVERKSSSRYNICGVIEEIPDKVLVVGAGKACPKMALAVEQIFSDKLSYGFVNVLKGTESVIRTAKIKLNPAGHPLPDEGSLEGAKEILNLISKAHPNELLLVLISGGGSALMELPMEGISLEDLIKTNKVLVSCGANIREINTIRKHISRIKGGRLLQAARSDRVISLIISDVVGDPLDSIASGPTAPDETTFTEALEVIHKYSLEDKLPDSVLEVIKRGVRGEIPETPKPGDALFDKVSNYIIANNRLAVCTMESFLKDKGVNVLNLGSRIEGEAREVGRVVASILKSMSTDSLPLEPPAALVFGGETTVTLRGNGIGGRNQELVLAMVEGLSETGTVVAASLGTDGIDGVSDAAGALADSMSKEDSSRLGMKASDYLNRNDSNTFFSRLGDVILTGPTLTNVTDIFASVVLG